MIDPASGPFLFDTSATSYFARARDQAREAWMHSYLAHHPAQISVVTVLERMRGYAMALERAEPPRHVQIDAARSEYLHSLTGTKVLPLVTGSALVAAHLMALCPAPPSPPRRTHRLLESRQERLCRWRFDILIAATALVANIPLLHHNPEDFETLRGTVERFPEHFPGVGPLQLISVHRLV